MAHVSFQTQASHHASACSRSWSKQAALYFHIKIWRAIQCSTHDNSPVRLYLVFLRTRSTDCLRIVRIFTRTLVGSSTSEYAKQSPLKPSAAAHIYWAWVSRASSHGQHGCDVYWWHGSLEAKIIRHSKRVDVLKPKRPWYKCIEKFKESAIRYNKGKGTLVRITQMLKLFTFSNLSS
jgi:hypothetical protein